VLFQNSSVTYGTKLLAALVPNLALGFMVDHLFHCELEGDGLTFEYAFFNHKNFSFNTGLAMLLVDTVLFAFVGLHFDQAMSL